MKVLQEDVEILPQYSIFSRKSSSRRFWRPCSFSWYGSGGGGGAFSCRWTCYWPSLCWRMMAEMELPSSATRILHHIMAGGGVMEATTQAGSPGRAFCWWRWWLSSRNYWRRYSAGRRRSRWREMVEPLILQLQAGTANTGGGWW